MKKIKELQERSNLNEGRDYGVGFTILNKIGNKYETYLPFTACRDFLNDFSYVEHTKLEIGNVYGYDHTLLNCFKKKQYFHIGILMLDYQNGNDWERSEKATKIMVDNHKNLQLLINKVEDSIGLLNKTVIKVDEDALIIKAPIYWSKSTALISLYTLLIRCHFNVNPELLNESLETILEDNVSFISDDVYMQENVTRAIVNFEKLKSYKIDKINYSEINITEKYKVHNFGIEGFLNMYNIN